MEGLNISSQENYVNEDINVVFTPNSSITGYEYTVYKNNVAIEKVTVSENKPTNILLNETGQYKIEIKTYDLYNNEQLVTSGYYNIDKDVLIFGASRRV